MANDNNNRKEHYSGALTSERFRYNEIRTVAQLLCDGMDPDRISAEVYDENLFQYPTRRKIKDILRVCFNRLDALDSEELTEGLAELPPEKGRQINLYAIMRENSIVYDFMTEVIGEKYRCLDHGFSPVDISSFLARLAEKVPSVAQWSDSTLARIKQVLRKILIESGFLESVRSEKLSPVMICPELESVVRARGERDVLAAFGRFD